MGSISLPNRVTVTLDTENEFRGTAVIEPLYPGYGATVGNSLRRVLLSSLTGGAVYAFKIKGVSHEFTSIDYVKEDVVDISLNLKRVNMKCHSAEPVELTLKATGAKVLTAGDIEPNADVEIANPDQVIMTLTDKAASVEMTLWVRQGRGYETIETRQDEELEVHAIAIDSIFTPVREVGYRVDNIRVGGRTDYDKVIIDIETNGTIGVREALVDSAKILAEHFTFISEEGSDLGFSTPSEEEEIELEENKEEVE